MHPNDDVLRSFANGSLGFEEILEIDDHLAGCPACRARAAGLAGAGDAIDAFADAMNAAVVHLTEEEVQLMADRRMPADQLFRVRRHLAECAVCTRQVDDLTGWTRPSARRWLPVAAAAALFVLAAIPAGVWYMRGSPHPAGNTAILRTLTPEARSRVEAALRTGVAALPPFMSDLAPPREVLMGRSDAGAAFDVIEPAGTVIVEDRPTFSWQAVPDPGEYQVTVFDEAGGEALRSPSLASTRWTAPSPLRRGATYTWQVRYVHGERSALAPSPPAPPARFRIADAASAAELNDAAAAHPEAHLVLGILYMESGVRDRAISELRQVAADEPGADVARRSLARLESVMRPR